MYLCFSIFLWSLEPFQRSKFLSQIEFLSALYFSPSFRGNIFICFLNHSKGMIFGRFWWVIWSHLAAQLLTNKTGFGKHFEVVLAGCLCKPFRIFSLFHARDKSKKKHLSLKNGLFENWHLSWLNSFVSLKNKWAIPGSLLENCFVFTVDQTGFFFLTRAEEFLSYRSYTGFLWVIYIRYLFKTKWSHEKSGNCQCWYLAGKSVNKFNSLHSDISGVWSPCFQRNNEKHRSVHCVFSSD